MLVDTSYLRTGTRVLHRDVVIPTSKTDDDLELLTTEQAAAILGVAELTVQRYVKNKGLRCVRVGSRYTRFRKKDLQAFAQKHVTTGARTKLRSKK